MSDFLLLSKSSVLKPLLYSLNDGTSNCSINSFGLAFDTVEGCYVIEKGSVDSFLNQLVKLKVMVQVKKNIL